ncbi:MAG: HupE/UreJ family protein [Pseudomonadota bacterium]
MWSFTTNNRCIALEVMLLILLAWGLLLTPAKADVFASAQFNLMPDEEEPGEYLFTAQVPQSAVTTRPPTWPKGCMQKSMDQRPLGKTLLYAYVLACPDGLAGTASILAPWRVDGAKLSAFMEGRRIERSFPGSVTGIVLPIGEIAANPKGLIEAATHYTWQGIVHIWIGWDHLAFVLCLCLLSHGRQLLFLVTAFTLGHSISLALSFFDVLTIAIAPVEAVIALSIALMAREALLYLRDKAKTARTLQFTVIVTLFGLIHGLGFASALEGLGVIAQERVPALIFFNVGVEVGQLLFVAAVLVLLKALAAIQQDMWAKIISAWCAGIIGCYWTIERILGFEGLAL